jgi:hypothetical protein
MKVSEKPSEYLLNRTEAANAARKIREKSPQNAKATLVVADP